VALAQIMSDGQLGPGSVWLVPPGLHDALRQDAVLLERGRHNPAAMALMQYLRGDGARQLMRASGYAFSAP
jgi:molybdate transport system substrate-binding protein